MTAARFALKKKVLGSSKPAQEPIAIKDPETKEIVTSVEKIKSASLKYCVELLTNRPPKKEYEQVISLKEQLHELRMKETVENEPKMSRKFFDETLKEIEKGSTKYNFITKAGESFKTTLFSIFKHIWKHEVKLDAWRLDTLIQIHKKESKEDLDNYRNIHLREDTSKVFSYMVAKLIKPKIKENISRFQIGGIPGHRSQEHLFCMRSLISLYNERLKKPILVSLLDVSKFFDKEHLKESLDSVYSCNIKGKLYRLYTC